jgi:uncharacterized protein YjiS (DUF1127 family)
MHKIENGIAFRRATPEQVRAVSIRARKLRAEAMQEFFASVGRGIVTGVRWTVSTAGSLLSALGQARAADKTYHELSRLSDRELADIGVRRSEIARVAWGLSGRMEDPAVGTPEAAEEVVEQKYREAA